MWLDVVLVLLAVLAAMWGWMTGAASAAFALLGVAIGAVSGLLVAPHLVSGIDSPLLRLIAGLAAVGLMVTVGQVAGVTLGRAVRRYITHPGAHFVDSVVGALLQATTFLLVAWLAAIPISAQEHSRAAQVVRGSEVLARIDAVAPEQMRRIPSSFSRVLGDTGFPDILGPFGSTPMREVPEPDTALSGDPVVDRVHPSVLKILGRAGQCQRALEGSGFVVDHELVMTNAHVVAGTDTVRVETGGQSLPATVVHYDSEVDVAVLRVPGLQSEPLALSDGTAPDGTDGIVVGYPGNGPYTAEPVRVRETVTLRGPNIYRDSTVEREVYTLRGTVREGNSGGPVVDREGTVLGVVFGAATDASDTGYALTVRQVGSQLESSRGATEQVPTGRCVGSK